MSEVDPGLFVGGDEAPVRYEEPVPTGTPGLLYLSHGRYTLRPRANTGELHHPHNETLMLNLTGPITVEADGTVHELGHYDTVYVPCGKSHVICNDGTDDARVAVFRAPSDQPDAPVVVGRFEEVRGDTTGRRLRKLKQKDVFVMFGEDRQASKLVGGYTIFEPFARSWPIHLHEDQEEIYAFIKGRGAMEVFANEEAKRFVREVRTGDCVTIPMRNYHPVFSFEEELHFIWVIAGARYWVGDRDRDFMEGARRA